MNTLLHRPLAILLLPLLLGASLFAQRPQGAGRDMVAVAAGTSPVGVTKDGVLLRSTDGGNSYSEVLFEPGDSSERLLTLAAKGPRIIAGGSEGWLVSVNLNDAPPTPAEIHVPDVFGDCTAIAHDGNQTWVAVTDAGDVVQSTNDGASWGLWSGSTGFTLRGIAWNAANGTWVAVGDNTVFTRAPAAADWTALNVGTQPQPLLAVAADGFDNVLVAGEQGTLFISSDNGLSFTPLLSGVYSENLRSISVAGENHFVVGGDQRLLLEFDDGVDAVLLQPVDGSEDVVLGSSFLDGAVVLAGVASVPAPAISSPVTISTEPIQVTLLPNAGVGSSTHYTLDGNDPSTASTTYAAPFWVTDDLTLKAVSVFDGVYSVIVSQAYQAELIEYDLGIALGGANLLITLSDSLDGQPYQLQYSSNLAAVPQVWTNEGDPKPGTGTALLWTLTPIPGGTRAWRAVLP